MDKAKAAVSDFMKKAGHHDTTVHETVAPGVTHETVKSHQHENVQTAVDKEVHQDHYHRTVQPVQDREVLPEQHTAKLGAVQHREFDHRDGDHTKRALVDEQNQFRDERIVHDTTQSQSAAPTVGGEHVHHHIHETIQPVVEKEKIQPSVVHTTVPIHEVHHNAAQHHGASTLPPVTMGEYKGKGGVLGGREERYDGFEGEPKNMGGTLSGLAHGEHQHNKHDSHHNDSKYLEREGKHGDLNPLDGRSHQHGTEGVRADGVPHSTTGTGVGNTTSNSGVYGAERGLEKEHRRDNDLTEGGDFGRDLDKSRTTTGTTPSLMDKVNPKVDANGDGKAGFMK